MIEDYNTTAFKAIIDSQGEDINQIRSALSKDSVNISSLIKQLSTKDKQIEGLTREIESSEIYQKDNKRLFSENQRTIKNMNVTINLLKNLTEHQTNDIQ